MIPADNRILYFGRDSDAFGCFSHFYRATILLDGEDWPTVEHYYQAQKSDNPAYRLAIRDAPTPGLAKRLAAPPLSRKQAQQSWFRKNKASPRADWHEVKLVIMRRADLAKYTQHAELAAILLATGDAVLVEDAPSEPFWGIGPDGLGLNWAGRVLMEVRATLRGG